MTRQKADYIGIGEACELAGVSQSTLRRWDRDGKLKPSARTSGKHRLYRRSEVVAAMKMDAGATTLIYVGVPKARVNGAIEVAKKLCRRNKWSVEVHLATEKWKTESAAMRGVRLRHVLSTESVARLVLPNAACAAPMTSAGLNRFCASLGIDFIQVDRLPPDGTGEARSTA